MKLIGNIYVDKNGQYMVLDKNGGKLKRRTARKALQSVIKKTVRGEQNPVKNYYLYALKLEQGKYYVGMTSTKDAIRRFEQHKRGKGARWTKRYKPIEIIETRSVGRMTTGECAKMENDMTVEYIDKYGISSVRGGDMCYSANSRNQQSYNRHSKPNIVRPAYESTEPVSWILEQEF